MKNAKIILAVVLALAMVFALAACGTPNNTTPAPNNTNNANRTKTEP